MKRGEFYIADVSVNIGNSHGDFYWYRKIAIKYYPCEAKKDSLKIKTLIC